MKHPAALGQPTAVVRREIWDVIGLAICANTRRCRAVGDRVGQRTTPRGSPASANSRS